MELICQLIIPLTTIKLRQEAIKYVTFNIIQQRASTYLFTNIP